MTGNALKLIAVVCMVIDHVAWAFVPAWSVPWMAMHFVGRITMPVMAFMVVEGYVHTHDFTRYALRLLVFALISDIPFMAFERSTGMHNVMFTLFLGLMAIRLIDMARNEFAAFMLCSLVVVVSVFTGVDWSFIGVLLCVAFWQFRGNFLAVSLSVSAMAFMAAMVYGQYFQFGLLLSLPLLRLYNGQRGSQNRLSKWGFYGFYPAHLAALAALRAVI
jgi:hypothetical protein